MNFKRFIWCLAVLCLTGMGSCSKYLDKQPDDQLTLEMVFNNKTNVEKWLAGLYNAIPDSYGYAATDPMGDDLAPSPRWEQFGFSVIAYQVGNWSASTTWNMDYWNVLPQRIRSAYIFMDNVKPLPDQYISSEEATFMKAEARFLIAYYHYLLLNFYGAVPIIREAASEDISTEILMVKQEPFDEVVDWIDHELTEAAKELPPFYAETTKYGRITSIMCHAIRAKLLLFAASPLVNGNSEMSGVVNSEGIPIFNSSFDPQKWDRAADALKELIDLAEANGHTLHVERLSNGTIDPFLSYQNALMKRYDEGNTEILMARPSVAYNNWDIVSQPRGTGGTGAVGVTQSLVDAFFMENGLPPIEGYLPNGSPQINPLAGYTEEGFSTEDEIRQTRWKESNGSSLLEENKVTLAGTYNMYVNREPRFYVSVLYNGSWFNRANRMTDFYMNGRDGGPTHDAPQNGYLVRKKVDPDANPINNVYRRRVGILYRLAEAYLSYAEALNEMDYGGNLSSILTYVNAVRERAGIPKYGNSVGEVAVPASQEAMRKAIHQERRVELNCENGVRFDDIRRWKQAAEKLEGNFWGMNFNGTKKSDDETDPEAYFTRQVYQERKFRGYWMPVPQADLDKNPNLTQTPGW